MAGDFLGLSLLSTLNYLLIKLILPLQVFDFCCYFRKFSIIVCDGACKIIGGNNFGKNGTQIQKAES